MVKCLVLKDLIGYCKDFDFYSYQDDRVIDGFKQISDIIWLWF